MSIVGTYIKKFASTLKKVIGAFREFTSYLTPADDWVEGLKRRLVTKANPIMSRIGRPLVFHCHDEDFMYTVDKDSDAVERAIHPTYQRNLTSTRKYRYVDEHGEPIPKGEEGGQLSTQQWSAGSWVLDPDDTDWQHHVYLFEDGDAGEARCDIYGHKEISAEKDPHGHVSGEQENGDPDENVVPLLADAGITRVN